MKARQYFRGKLWFPPVQCCNFTLFQKKAFVLTEQYNGIPRVTLRCLVREHTASLPLMQQACMRAPKPSCNTCLGFFSHATWAGNEGQC